jgi:predicted nucleic acid-binding protein
VTILIDSDILIEVARGRDAEILARWAELAESGHVLLCSPVSVAELWHGARPREHDALTNLFHVLTCVPADAQTGLRAGEYLRRYRKSHGVELGDALIGSAAILNGAALWTRNRKHYPMKELSFY